MTATTRITTDGSAGSAVGRMPAALVPTAHRPLVWRCLIAVLAVLVLWFALLEQRALWEPDEGRYAEIAREMLTTGDWITPRLNDLLYFEKPPLQYWATAAAYELFGVHHWTARLWSVVTGLAGLLLVFYGGLRLRSRRAGVYAALMLASSLLYFALAHLNTLDMGFTLFVNVAVFGLAFSLQPRAVAARDGLWIYVAWFAAGLAVLSKGLAGLALPLGTLVLYSILYRDHTIWRRLSALKGFALFVLVSAPWFIAVARVNPDFASFFFVHEHLTRYLTTEHHRAAPWWFFVPILALGALPWTVPMLRGWWRALRAPRQGSFSPFAFLAVFALVVFVFFSASGSKLPSYIVPLFPALAVLAARYLCEAAPAAIAREVFWPTLIMGVLMLAAPYAGVLHPSGGEPWPEDARLLCGIAAGLWVAGATFSAWAFRRARIEAAVIVLALTLMAAHQIVFVGAERIAPAKSSLALARQMKPYLDDATRVYAVQTYPQSLPVYLGRTVTLVNVRGELDFGLTHAPRKGIPTIAAFREIWDAERDALAVMPKTTYADLVRSGIPMRLIAEDAERVAVLRP